MPKISELTVADLRGARDQIEAHLKERCGLSAFEYFSVETGEHGEVTSTCRCGDRRSARVKWHGEPEAAPVDPALLERVSHVWTPKHLLKGLHP